MTTYYVDSSYKGPTNATGLSVDSPLSSLQAVNKLKLQPGDTVAFKAGTTYSASATGTGALNIGASGTEKNPITYTTYGTGPAATIINSATGYSDAINVSNSKYIVISDLNLAGAGQAGINVTKSSSNISIVNVEASNVGEGVILNGTNNIVTKSYFHDLKMIKNTSAIYDDDYGAVGVMIGNSHNEVSFTKIVNAKASSFDYGHDGGGIELFGSMTNIKIHNNWIENSDGFIEIGGNKSSISNISVSNNVSLNNNGFLVMHNGGGNFGSTISKVDISSNTIVEERNTEKEMASVFLDAPAKDGQLSFKNNTVYLNNGDSIFKQQGSYHYDNVFYMPSKATHLYNNWNMALNSGETFATLHSKNDVSIIEAIKSQFAGFGSSLLSSSKIGVDRSSAVVDANPSPVTNTPGTEPTNPQPIPSVITPTIGTGDANDSGNNSDSPSTKTIHHSDKSYDVYTSGVTGKDYASAHTHYDSTGKAVLIEQFRLDGSLTMKKTIGAVTTTEVYNNSGASTTKTVQQADKSYDVYATGVTGKDYTSAHTRYDGTGKVLLMEQFRIDGSLMLRKTFGTVSTTDVYDNAGALTSKTVQQADGSYDVHITGVTGKGYVSAHTSYDKVGKVEFSNLTNVDGSHTQTVYQSGQKLVSTVGVSDTFKNFGENTFTFPKGFGTDTIIGFNAGSGSGHDKIWLDNAEVSNFTELQSHMTTVGMDTVLKLSATDTIVLKDVQMKSLTLQNFEFHDNGLLFF